MYKVLRNLAISLVATLLLFTSLSFDGLRIFAEDNKTEVTYEDYSENANVTVVAPSDMFEEGTVLDVTDISDDEAWAIAYESLGEELESAKGVKVAFSKDGEEVAVSDFDLLQVSANGTGTSDGVQIIIVDNSGYRIYVFAERKQIVEEAPVEETVGEIEEPVQEETEETEAPADEPAEEPNEEPVDEPVENNEQEPIEEPTENTGSVEEPTEEPVTEEPVVEEPADEPTPSEEPVENPVEEPVETPTDEPVEEPTPVEQSTEEPVVEPVPVEEPVTEEPTPAIDEPVNEEPAEIKYPAVRLTGMAGGVSVVVNAPEGALPEGTKMVVTAVPEEDVIELVNESVEGTVTKVRAVDITFWFEEKEIQPNLPISVVLSAFMDAEENKQVVHISDDNVVDVLENADTTTVNKNTTAQFEAEKFSIYAIVETGTDARLLVKFMNGSTEIDSMYVKKNDDMTVVLYDPGAGALAEGVYFRGWTTDENYTTKTEAKTIEEVRAEVATQLQPATDGTTVTYYAMLFKDYRITYLDENDISLGQEEVTFRADSTETNQSYTINMAYTVPDDTHHFEGWTVVEGGGNIAGHTEGKIYQNTDEITITGDVTFGVNAPEGHWFIFNENGKGATYNAPQFVYSTEKPVRPNDANMVRSGYTFGGWFADKATADQTSGGTQYNFNQTLSDKTTVYARWIPKTTADYTIIIWKQNLAGTGYDFYNSITLTGNVNSTINTVSSNGSGNNRYARINGTNYNSSYTSGGQQPFKGFHLKEFDQNVTIKTEGNSVLNVYYDRNEHTLQFQEYGYTYTPTSGNNGTQYGLVNGEYVTLTRYEGSWYYYSYGWHNYSGTRYTRSNYQSWHTIKEITALYGQSISDNFPIVGTNGRTYDQGERWSPQGSSTYNNVLVYIDIMPDEDVTFHLDEASHTTKNIYYYVEALPGETDETVSYNGKTFVLHKHMAANYGFFTQAEDYLDFVGFTKYGYTPNNAWGSGGASTVYCYYTRNVYPINFMDGKYVSGDGNPIEESGMGQIETIEKISYGVDVSSYNSHKPNAAHTPSGYVFEGWYIDSSCTQPYTFGTMPEGGITVYAKWRQKEYRVFLHPNYPTGATGYIDWGTNQSMCFRVSEGGNVSEPTGRLAGFEFVGWYLDENCTKVFNGEAYTINESSVTTDYDKTVDMTDTYDQNGNLIDPKENSDVTGYNGGDRFWITKKLDLYAKWRSTLDGASGIVVEYNANGGSGAPTDIHTYVDGADAPAGAASKSSDAKKVFGYWEVQKWNGSAYVGTGITVLPGDTFKVLAANAKVEDIENPVAGGDTKKYTVQLKAVYIDSEEPTPTHIYWYKNDGTDAYVKNDNAVINVGINIPDAPTREGYNFIGWTRVDIGSTQEAATAWEGNSANWTQNLDADDLYLYVDENGKYHMNSTSGTEVTQVAPDENLPYHAMFAVWQPALKIRITGSSDEKVYNGLEQSVTGYEVEYKVGDGEWTTTAPAGVTVSLASGKEAIAKGTNVDTYSMRLTKEHFDITAGNYFFNDNNIEIIDGELEITPKKVTITAKDANKPYDGSALTQPEFTATALEEGDTHTFTVVMTTDSTITNVGTQPNVIATVDGIAVIVGTEKAVGNYLVTTVNGKLEITSITVTVKAQDASKQYGESDPAEFTATVTGLIPGDTITYTVSRESGENVGHYDIIPSGDKIQGNYIVVYKNGDFEITKAKLTVTADDKTKVYGEDDPELTATVTGLQNGDAESVITYTLSRVEGEDVGTYTITPAGAAEQGNYNVVYATGELSILARTVVLTSATDSKVYDGTPLTNDNVTVSGDGFVEGEVTDIKATGSALLPGDVKDNPISYTTTDKFNAQNYQITEEIGKLTITSRNDEDEDPDNDTYKIEFNVNDGTFTYDGKEHNVEGYVEENEDGTLTWKNDKGIEFTITGIAASETKTDAGEYTVESTGDPIVKDADGNDVTSQFTVTVNDGTLTINKKAVTLTSADDSKYYDGTPLTNDTVTAEGFVEGEGATYDVTGTITYVGTAKNEFTYELNENTKAGNYEITTVFGTLEIKSRNDEDEDPDNDTYKVEFNVNKGTFTYDGKEHTVEGYIEENEDGTLTWTNDKGVKFTISGISASETKTDAGKYAVTSTGKAVVKDPAGVDVTDQFTVTVNDGELLINPKEITVKIDGNKEDVLYDGKEHTVEGYTVECDDELFNEENVKFTGDDKVSGTEPGTYPMGLEEDQFSYDDPNFVVKFEVTDGELQLSTLEKYSYKVEHYLQNLEDDKFTLKDTENLEASFNQTVKATAKEYEGFTLDKTVEGTVESAVVKIDGEVVLRLYYTRDTFDLTFKLNGGIFNGSTEDIIETYKYGEVIKIHEAPTREGYEFTHWEGSKYYPGDEYTVTEDHTFTAQWNRVDVPQTGDANNAKLWLALFGVSLSNSLALAYVSLKKKKEEE